MAVCGVYSEAEQKMVDDTNKKAEELVGWFKSPTIMTASEESMKLWANCVDYWNPLWRDDIYAGNTRWGGIIAAPFYHDRFLADGFEMQINPGCGPTGKAEVGGECEFYRPIRAGDRFRLWNNRPVFEDTTSSEMGGMRSFVITSSSNLINQKDELVITSKSILGNLFPSTASPPPERTQGDTHSGGPPGEGAPSAWSQELHKYTREELEFIERIEGEEKIRGADILYWEDVEVNDDLNPIISGPITILDMIRFGGINILSMPPMREIRKSGTEEIKIDPETGIAHIRSEAHYADRPASLFSHGKHALIFSTYGRSLLARMVTNWMGDDGWLRKLRWVNRGIDLLDGAIGEKKSAGHIIVGTTLIGRGKITNKRFEKNEHFVDLLLWLEDIQGNISTAANATISLYSREQLGVRK